jgi:sec-independent protein translocase protein TatB
MFDIGWGELFLIGVVALIVVGPKELPGLFRTAGQWTARARAMAREFQRSLEQAASESGMDEVTRSLRSIESVNLRSPTQTARSYAAKAMSGDAATGGAAAAPKPDEPAPSTAGEPAPPPAEKAAEP